MNYSLFNEHNKTELIKIKNKNYYYKGLVRGTTCKNVNPPSIDTDILIC